MYASEQPMNGANLVPILVNGRPVMVEKVIVDRLHQSKSPLHNKSFLPDEIGFQDGDIGSLVRQGIKPSEFEVPKFREAAEYVLAQTQISY
jgi:hypothetical protein